MKTCLTCASLLASLLAAALINPPGGAAAAEPFVRGDVNVDGAIDVGDPIGLLFHLFEGTRIGCESAADVDDSGGKDLSDAIRLLEYLFLQGPPPSSPFPACGVDPNPDTLGCISFEPCRTAFRRVPVVTTPEGQEAARDERDADAVIPYAAGGGQPGNFG